MVIGIFYYSGEFNQLLFPKASDFKREARDEITRALDCLTNNTQNKDFRQLKSPSIQAFKQAIMVISSSVVTLGAIYFRRVNNVVWS
jgi:hypothetical protein